MSTPTEANPFEVFRPRRGRYVAIGLMVAVITIFTFIGFFIEATKTHDFKPIDRVFFASIGWVLAVLFWRYATIKAIPDRNGLIVRNLFTTRTVTWPQVDGCEEIAESLREDGATVHVDLGDLHASEFHDGPAFQIHVDGGRPLGDGGSYGGYASTFAGADTALFAAVVGLERLADIMIASGRAPSAPAADVAVLAMPDASSRRHADELALALRRSGVSVWDAERDGRGTRQRRLLEAAGICWTVTIGPRDIEAGTYAIRDPRGTVHHVSAHDVIGWLQSLLSGDADVP